MLKWKNVLESLVCVIIRGCHRTSGGSLRQWQVRIGPVAIVACGVAVAVAVRVIK